MASVSIEKSLAIDLVNTKLSSIVFEINNILKKWNYDDPKKFISDAKEGILEESEDDAISLRNLLDIRGELFNLRKKWD